MIDLSKVGSTCTTPGAKLRSGGTGRGLAIGGGRGPIGRRDPKGKAKFEANAQKVREIQTPEPGAELMKKRAFYLGVAQAAQDLGVAYEEAVILSSRAG